MGGLKLWTVAKICRNSSFKKNKCFHTKCSCRHIQSEFEKFKVSRVVLTDLFAKNVQKSWNFTFLFRLLLEHFLHSEYLLEESKLGQTDEQFQQKFSLEDNERVSWNFTVSARLKLSKICYICNFWRKFA